MRSSLSRHRRASSSEEAKCSRPRRQYLGARLVPSKVALRMALTVLRESRFMVATSSSCGATEGVCVYIYMYVCVRRQMGCGRRPQKHARTQAIGVQDCYLLLTVTHVLHHCRSDMSRQEWMIRTLVSFLKATLRRGDGNACCWVRLGCCPRDDEDGEEPDDRRRRGGGADAWGAAARSTTELLGPPLKGRLSSLFRRIMALLRSMYYCGTLLGFL